MSSSQITTLNELLQSRERNGRWLAREMDKPEATVSRWRSGLIPSKANRQLIYGLLGASEAEIVALGWEREAVNV